MDRINLPEKLRSKVLASIRKEELKRARLYVVGALVVGFSSVASVLFLIPYIARVIAQSSLYQYISLLFSDSDIVLSYWKSFMMSLVESIPFFAVTLILFALVVFMTSIRVFIKNSGRNFNLSFSN